MADGAEKLEDGIVRSAEQVSASIRAARDAIGATIFGQERVIENALVTILSGGHALLIGVPGLAKTKLVETLGTTLGLDAKRIQFTPDLMPSDVLGTPVFNPQQSAFEFKKGPVFSNIILVDEINRAPAKTQSALLEIMEERQATVDGKTYPMAQPFMVLATQNPVEQEGTYRLPEAQLDRFLFKIVVQYPSEMEEMAILSQFHNMGNSVALDLVHPVLGSQQIITLRKQIRTLVIEEKLLQFIAKLVHQTRIHKSIYLGASPRASLAIMNASKATAAISGRDFVTPDDILSVVPAVLRHRIILSPDKEMEGITEDEVIRQILQSMDVPR